MFFHEKHPYLRWYARFFGALLWSLNSPLVKYLHMDSVLLCGLRAAIAAASLCVFIRPKQLKWNGWMLVYVTSYASLSLCIIPALTMTSAPIAIGMQYTATVWLFLTGCILNKRFDFRSALPVFIIIICALVRMQVVLQVI